MQDIKKLNTDSSEFIAMLAHDMKTPVKAQIRAMNLLYSGMLCEFSSEAKNLILNVIASNKYLQTLLDNVLGNYRINNEVFSLNPKNSDLRKTIEEALLNIGILSEVKGQEICINYLTQDFIKFYDEIEIQRVIINMLSNAFEYGLENSKILLTLENNSIKTKFSVVSKISPQIGAKKGYGLGLNISKKIIKMHGGDFSHGINKNQEYFACFTLP